MRTGDYQTNGHAPGLTNGSIWQPDLLGAEPRDAAHPTNPMDVAGCLHHLVRAQAQRTPEAPAVIWGTAVLSYGELEQRASQLAHFLQAHGAAPDVVVGLCVERSLDLLVGMLGILKAGAAYLPLDPAYPAERLAFMLEDAQVPLLVTRSTLASSLPDLASQPQAARIVCLDSDWPEIAAFPTTAPAVAVTPEHLAYVIYTSGSTGKPKGVAMPHQSPVNLILWQARQPSFEPGARTLQFTPISFDVSCQEVFSTWGSGGTLVVVDDATRRNPVALLQFIYEREIGRVFLPFTALQHLAGAAEHGPLPTALREVITAGEQLQIIPAIRRLFEQLPECVLQNQYGMTEVQTVTQHTLSGPASDWPLLPPIGGPLPNCAAFILDEARQPVAAGETGELYLGGVQVARGYLHRPDLTAERFIANPFGAGRLYKTGDLARTLPDGSLEFQGRIDGLVKIRGMRVELGEIEIALARHPAVKEVAVAARDDMGSGKRLVAYVIPTATPTATPPANGAHGSNGTANSANGTNGANGSNGANPGANALATRLAAELYAFAVEHLPDHMVPARFVVLDAFPLTPSGKVDRKALPRPSMSRPELAARYVAPRSALEKRLAAIWQDVLQLETVGVLDSFFELGGHSLLLAQVQTRLAAAFGPERIATTDLFQYPTIQTLAQHLEQPQTAAPSGAPERADRSNRQEALRQQRQRRQRQRTGEVA